jgi:hypothetical protein
MAANMLYPLINLADERNFIDNKEPKAEARPHVNLQTGHIYVPSEPVNSTFLINSTSLRTVDNRIGLLHQSSRVPFAAVQRRP